MNSFYIKDCDKNSKIITLEGDEAFHCLKVLRSKKNDIIRILNGNGIIFIAKIVDIQKNYCSAEVINYIEEDRDNLLHIAISPTKNEDRFEWFVEKATEIGVDVITPVICNRTERKSIKFERIEKIIISALKQSARSFKPVLNNIIKFNEFIDNHSSFAGIKLIAHCYSEDKKKLNDIYLKSQNTVIMIGPEGDFTDEEEIKLAMEKNFIAITLGKNRLRTETSGVVACSIITFLNNSFC